MSRPLTIKVWTKESKVALLSDSSTSKCDPAEPAYQIQSLLRLQFLIRTLICITVPASTQINSFTGSYRKEEEPLGNTGIISRATIQSVEYWFSKPNKASSWDQINCSKLPCCNLYPYDMTNHVDHVDDWCTSCTLFYRQYYSAFSKIELHTDNDNFCTGVSRTINTQLWWSKI